MFILGKCCINCKYADLEWNGKDYTGACGSPDITPDDMPYNVHGCCPYWEQREEDVKNYWY